MGSDEVATDVPTEVVDYLGEHNTMTLATASPAGIPHASTFLYVNDGAKLFFWAKPHTTTARHIDQNPMVSFAVDEYADDLSQTKGVQGAGECRVLLSGEEIARVADLFGQKFPTLAPGATMSISFFRVDADRPPAHRQLPVRQRRARRHVRGRVPQGALLQRVQRPAGARRRHRLA